MVGSYFLHENLKLEDFLRWVLRGPLSKTLRYTPENKTSHWKIPYFPRKYKKYIFKWWMFHCHLSFRGYPLRGTFRSKCLVFFKKLAPLAIPLAMLAAFHLPLPHLSWRLKFKCSPLKSYRDRIVVFQPPFFRGYVKLGGCILFWKATSGNHMKTLNSLKKKQGRKKNGL